MSLSKKLKRVRNEVPVSALFPITHLNTPSIFESQGGVMGAVLRIEGVAFEISENTDLNYKSYLFHQALLSLDSRFIVYITTHRQKTKCNIDGTFKSKFASDLNNAYLERFKNKSLYTSTHYLTLVLKGDTSTKTLSIAKWLKNISNKDAHLRALYREKNITILTEAIEQLKANLASFGAALLGENDNNLGFSELLQFLSLSINGGEAFYPSKAVYAPSIANSILDTFKKEALYPNGHIGQYLSQKQILFGEYIQFQGNTKDSIQFGAMLSLKKYPTDTASILLDSLLSMDCEFIATHTFAPLPMDISLKTIAQKRFKLTTTDDKAQSQIEALSNLEDNLASETALLGFHQHTLMLLSKNKEHLDEKIKEVTKRYLGANIAVVKETLGLEVAFWSQIPTNHHFIARSSLITSLNFVDFCPLHNTKPGFQNENFLGNAVTLLEGASKTPIFFNYHTKGSSTNPTKGHAAIFGGNNAGKTTLVNFLDAQMGRFDGRSFYIDRDESSKIYILASGNSSYLKISPSDAISMNPFSMPDSSENRAFLKSFMATLLLEEHETFLASEITDIINDAIDYAYDALATQFRNLSNISKFFPVNFKRQAQLKKWLKSANGQYSWIFDNETDSLNFDFDKVGIDVTYIMDRTHPIIANPVYLYLVHRMRQCLDGRLTSFVIDEAWQLFSSPFWEKCLKEWLPTIRKKNGHFIFMTQSPKTITTSPIQHVVLDNLATMIVFPNPMADETTYCEHLKLTKTQFEVILETPVESRLFLYKQEQDAFLCKLDLKNLSAFIRVLSGNTKSVKLLDLIIKDVGDNPDEWLPVFIERSAS